MNEKNNFRIKPYINEIKEGKRIFLLLIISYVFFFCMDISIPLKFVLALIFTFFSVSLTCYIPVLASIDKRFKKTKRANVKFEYADTEFTFLGDWWGHSNIGKQYDKPLYVDRYKLVFRKEDGKRLKLRSISSAKRVKRIYEIYDKFNIEIIEVTYLPLSKILVSIDVNTELTTKINTKLKDDFKKNLLNINNQI